jgi:hypothetical protein
MGGGLMQLVAYGAQDVYLTGNPQITYFKVVYRRHTNFSMEAIEHTLNGNPNFGRKAEVTILRNGDLAGRMYLKVVVDKVDLSAYADGTQFAWVRRLGHALIKTVEVEIGGSTIDKQYGIWLDIWYELTHTASQQRGYDAMIGDVPAMTSLATKNGTSSTVKDEYTIYVPLQFWFCRNTGLALPLIALQYHEVRVQFEFEQANNLFCWAGASQVDSRVANMKEAALLVDYIYLDSEERRRFAQVGHEYLIEQVQHPGSESIPASSSNTAIPYKSKLNFNHPTKEIIWAMKNGAFNGANSRSAKSKDSTFLCYTHDNSKWDSALNYAAKSIALGMFKVTTVAPAAVQVGGVATATAADGQTVGGTELTGSYNSSTGGRVFVRLVPHDIDGDQLTFQTTANSAATACYIELVDKVLFDSLTNTNLGDRITDVTVYAFVPQGGATPVINDVVVNAHTLDLTTVSVPLSYWTDNRVNWSKVSYVNGAAPTVVAQAPSLRDISVIQPNNYGLRLDGAGNPVASGNLQLNGHDRFEPRDGNYFNYVQPAQHHTRTPADGINVYSFGLHPEQHQPSGTANLSRIDNTLLVLRLADPFRTGKNVPKLSLSNGTELYIFAFSYNVLRIMSGMGGLAYSN